MPEISDQILCTAFSRLRFPHPGTVRYMLVEAELARVLRAESSRETSACLTALRRARGRGLIERSEHGLELTGQGKRHIDPELADLLERRYGSCRSKDRAASVIV